MQIEEGKFYKDRAGRKVGPMERVNNPAFPFRGLSGSTFPAFTKEGKWNADGSESRYDLIEEWIEREPEQEHIMQFFAYSHLPEHLQLISKPFASMAEGMSATLPRNPERTVALRKLLEAKDAAVRAFLAK